MNLSNWKIFDKHGSPINWYADAYIPLNFAFDASSTAAAGYLISDSSGSIVDSKITNSGFYYYDPTIVKYNYVFDDSETDISSDVSVVYVDVSIFNPNLSHTQGIGTLADITIPGDFLYPSTVYSSAIFLEPVSQGLVETEHLYILEESGSNLIRPYDSSNYTLVVRMVGEDDEIKLFTVDENEETITWTDELVFELNELVQSTPLTLNIGFRSEEEGVYERSMRIYNVINGVYYTMGEILVNAESIGEDERFRTLLANFGLPDPKDFPRLFKEADINEDLPDYKIINPKSKHIFLEHDKIIPYIGTYKALINAIKWLGYEDIYVREWFKNVKEDKKLSLIIPYDAADRTQTILMFSAKERRALKKLNQLSLNYCINRNTGEIDDWGTPLTENCYEYNIEEVFVKLIALKKWLEKNIIGVNARIIDITGEGIYYERYINLTWSTDLVGFDYFDYQSLTPHTTPDSTELILGEASINMTLLEYTQSTIGYQNNKFSDYINYIWDPNDPSTTLSPNDPSYLANPNAYLAVGVPLSNPFVGIEAIQWKAIVSKPISGVIPITQVTNPLWIYNNEIKFYNIFDSSTIFHDTSVNVSIKLENAYLRDASSNDWRNSAAYTVYPDPDPSLEGAFIMESSLGTLWRFDDYVFLNQDTSSLLQYALNKTYRVPLLSLKNFKTIDGSGIEYSFNKMYHLDILDGKIIMDNIDSNDVRDVRTYINFDYDSSFLKQNINLDVEYTSPRMPLYVIDPSTYYWADPSGLSGGNLELVVDNSTYVMTVNHIGNYDIEVFAWDGYNVLYTNSLRNPHNVYIQNPIIYTLNDKRRDYPFTNPSVSINDVSILISENTLPIYDRDTEHVGLTFKRDGSNNDYINIPAVTYFQSLPPADSITKYFIGSENITNIFGNIVTVNNLYEKFYANDDINLVKMYKGSYMSVYEASSHITSINPAGDELTLDNIPSEFVQDTSYNIYAINVTERTTYNITNDTSTTLIIDVSNYHFLDNQIVVLIVEDTVNNYKWGSSYRVLDSSIISDASWGYHHTLKGTMSDFLLNIDEYNDWFLPSEDEFQLLWGMDINFSGRYYWTSTEEDAGNSKTFDLNGGSPNIDSKGSSHYVRACRTFTAEAGKYSVLDTGPAGGVIFYASGTTYYEVAASDPSVEITWSNITGSEIGTTSNLFGEGQNNTNEIIAQSGHTYSAAQLCTDLSIYNNRYNITARHAYGSFANYELIPTNSLEVNNNFQLYQNDDRQYYLDNTFVMINIPFSQDYVNDQWYDTSLNLLTEPYYFRNDAINVEINKLVVLNILYDPCVYLLDQKNIWTIKENISKDIVLRVFNKSVPFVFDTLGYYDVIAESYDAYGNLASKTYEGLIHVI